MVGVHGRQALGRDQGSLRGHSQPHLWLPAIHGTPTPQTRPQPLLP